MTAEILKLRALPTPRWTALGALLGLATAITVAIFAGIGEDQLAVALGADLPTSVAAMILGVWIVGLEYGQGTMRRVLTAEPRRARVLAAKLGLALAAAVVLTVVVYAIAIAAFPSIASAHDTDLPVSDLLRSGAAALVSNVAYAAIGVAFALLTRSMAGGITIALVFAFVIESAVSAIPRVGDWTAQSSVVEIYDALTQQPGDHAVLRASLVLVAWVVGLVGLGAARFIRRDA